MTVVFECGSKEELQDVSEPARCAYEARATHPSMCAALAKTQTGTASGADGAAAKIVTKDDLPNFPGKYEL